MEYCDRISKGDKLAPDVLSNYKYKNKTEQYLSISFQQLIKKSEKDFK